jgi:hypothetical protein
MGKESLFSKQLSRHTKTKLTNFKISTYLAQRKVNVSLLLFQSLLSSFTLGQAATNSTSFLGTEINWNVLLSLVKETELVTLSLRNDSQDSGNILANLVTTCKHIEGGETYILANLEAAPPEI